MTITKNNKRLRRLLSIGLPLALILPNVSFGQAVEWDSEYGYHAEEWYDPSDWFDDDSSIDYEDDGLDYDYDYGSPYWSVAPWYDDVMPNRTLGPDYNYGTHYVWNEEEDRWTTEYGAYEEAYSYKMSFDDDDIESASSSSNQESASSPSAKSSSSSSSNSLTSNSEDGKEVMQLQGEIDAFSEMNLRYSGGFDMKHSLARVKLDNGKTAIIDLGYSSIVLADIKKGDDITLHGNKGQINGQNVFIATELETEDGNSINLERALTFAEDQKFRDAKRKSSQMASSSQSKSQQDSMSEEASPDDFIVLAGTVEDHQKKRLSTGQGERTFLKLRLENGEAATIDLGEQTSLSDLDLSEGDNIRVEGPKKTIDDRSVLLAKTISVAGEKVKEG